MLGTSFFSGKLPSSFFECLSVALYTVFWGEVCKNLNFLISSFSEGLSAVPKPVVYILEFGGRTRIVCLTCLTCLDRRCKKFNNLHHIVIHETYAGHCVMHLYFFTFLFKDHFFISHKSGDILVHFFLHLYLFVKHYHNGEKNVNKCYLSCCCKV